MTESREPDAGANAEVEQIIVPVSDDGGCCAQVSTDDIWSDGCSRFDDRGGGNEKEDQVMEMVGLKEPATSSVAGPQAVKAMEKVRKVLHSICSSPNVDLREFVNEKDLTNREYLLESKNSLLNDPQYHVRSGRNDVISHQNF